MVEEPTIHGIIENKLDLTGIQTEEEGLLPAISTEINRFEVILAEIDTEGITPAGYGALAGAIILNLICLMTNTETYMVVWILASLYFYLTYPLLPLVLVGIRYLFRSGKLVPSENTPGPVISKVKNLHLIKNHKIVAQLGIRFFIMSVMPLTSGMVLIYSISLLFAVILGITNSIPTLTSGLIVVQCLGILILYLDLAFLKRQFTFVTRSFRNLSGRNLMRYLLIAILGIVVVIIASCATIILLIATLLPGFTLGVYVDAASLVQNRTNLWILLLLMSQFIWMQCLQSILSRRLTSRFSNELVDRLMYSQSLITREDRIQTEPENKNIPIIYENGDENKKKIISLVLESRIHTISRSHLAGLFPTYSIGLNINELLRIDELKDLSEMFRHR